MTTTAKTSDEKKASKTKGKEVIPAAQFTVEVVSDSGEGAQKCAQIFASVCAKMGNGTWSVEIIPAEIQPPPRTPTSASGNRIRIGTDTVSNWGDSADLVVAFNEQVLLQRHRLNALAKGAIILIDDKWEKHEDADIQKEYKDAMDEMASGEYRIVPFPLEEESLKVVDDPTKGKNMFALGVLASIFSRDIELIQQMILLLFKKKSQEIKDNNIALLDAGYNWAEENAEFKIDVPTVKSDKPMVVMNGNQAVGFGCIASGMELCSMYPITPATSASHHISEMFERFGGIVHQAEDEIAAVGVAIGASYAGKVAFTITSGPGLALKTEFLGLAIMTEVPLVVVDVQRGGPSTGLPTKVEQSDLLASIFGQTGDAPHVVMAPATMEECFQSVITARRIAEVFRTVVIVLTDANLATGQQPFPRPELKPEWFSGPPDLSPVPEGTLPYDWDPKLGLSKRVIPGQANGMFIATGLSHDERSKIAYDSATHQRSSNMRSRKIAVLQSTLKKPAVRGDDTGDLLVVGWGSTMGAIEEAVDKARAEGLAVSSLHLRFLSPLEPGLKEIFSGFKKVLTVEINYSDEITDPYINEENRRRGQLSLLLRASTLVDVDCWTRIPGEPLQPGKILQAIRDKLPNGDKA